jgi:hypothetical protein
MLSIDFGRLCPLPIERRRLESSLRYVDQLRCVT